MATLAWALATERAIGTNHPVLADVVNRPLRQLLSQSGHNPDSNPFPGLFGPVFNVRAFGALGDGITNDTPARDAATAAALAAGGGIVYFPPGQYLHTTQPATLVGTPGIIYQGAGRNVTHIVLGTAGLALFDLVAAARVQIRDMWIGSASARASGYGLRSINPGYPLTPTAELIVERVTLQNLPTPIHCDNVAQSAFRDVRYLHSIASATVGIVCYLIRTVAVRLEDVMIIATTGSFPSDGIRVDSDSDTVVLHRCEVVLGGNGSGSAFRFMNSVGGSATGPRLCRLTDCYGENFSTGFQINDARDVRLRGCHVANSTLAGFDIEGGDSVTLTDCFAFSNGQHGYAINGGKGVHLIGCTATNNSQTTSNTYDGIFLNNANPTRVIGCRSGDILTTYSNKQRRGLSVFTAGHTIIGNDLLGNMTAALADFSGGKNRILDNEGVNSHDQVSADRGDTSQTLTVGTDVAVQRWATTLTANRSVTLSATGAFNGAKFRIVRTGLGAFTLDVGGLKTIPSATAAFVDVEYDGSAWRLTGYGTL